jgi:hypothetical protein
MEFPPPFKPPGIWGGDLKGGGNFEGATLYYFHPTYIHNLLDCRNEEELERLSHDSCDVGYPTRFQTILHWGRRPRNVPEAATEAGERHRADVSLGGGFPVV